MYQYFSVNSGVLATLPDTGFYVLKSHQLAVEGDSIFVHIGYGLNIDTVKQVDISESIKLYYNKLSKEKEWSGWLCCGKKCEGYKTDYYNNGNKRMQGKFKNGKPVGILKFYNDSGRVKYIEYYNKRSNMIKSEHIEN